jgi:glutamate---cysteine ligase / carboxylate-amine ligase
MYGERTRAYTTGVEEEYQLVDPVSADLRSSAHWVLAGDWTGEIRTETQESTIEIGTRVCTGSAEADAELRRLRMQAATAAWAEDLQIVAAGVHPFSDWRAHQLADGERYARMAQTYGRIMRDEHNYGMHIHVAVSGDRMQLMNRVRRFIPHLLALSCSSPYYEGEDTGYASYRMVLWRRWPGAGPPPRLASDAEYRLYVDRLRRAGVIGDERNLYWLIRPHPEYPTLEFRMCDVCPRVEDAVAIAGLARTLVFAAAEGMLPCPDDWSAEARDAVLQDECWLAARYGLDAPLVEPCADAGSEAARDATLRLLETLLPAADLLGEEQALAGVARILGRGNGADRLRAHLREHGDLVLATKWLVSETVAGTGLDRRGEPRAEVGCA